MSVLTILILAGLALVVLGVGWLALVKLGVIVHYATKPDRPEDKTGDYGLDQSRGTSDQPE